MKQKTIGQHLDKRIELVGKTDKNFKPTTKELEEAYGYLSYCSVCDKRFKFGDAHTHTMLGNYHKFGCGLSGKILGYVYTFFKTIFLLIVAIPVLIIVGVGKLWEKFVLSKKVVK